MTKDYRRANNIKHIVDGVPLYRWCKINGFPYGAAIQMLRRGLSVDQMTRRIKKNYFHKDKKGDTLYAFVKEHIKIYSTSDRDTRLKIRNKVISYRGRYTEEQLSNYMEMLVNGRIKNIYQAKSKTEVWLPIPGHPGYECSNLGNFRKKLKDGSYFKKSVFLTKRYNKAGDHNRFVARVKLSKNTYNAASLIAKTHLKRPSDDYTIIHLIDNSNRLNIAVDNLKWVTPWMHGHLTGSTPKTSRPIELLSDNGVLEETFISVREAAKELGISYTTVINICKGRIKKPQFKLKYGDLNENYIPTWGYGGGKRREISNEV